MLNLEVKRTLSVPVLQADPAYFQCYAEDYEKRPVAYSHRAKCAAEAVSIVVQRCVNKGHGIEHTFARAMEVMNRYSDTGIADTEGRVQLCRLLSLIYEGTT